LEPSAIEVHVAGQPYTANHDILALRHKEAIELPSPIAQLDCGAGWDCDAGNRQRWRPRRHFEPVEVPLDETDRGFCREIELSDPLRRCQCAGGETIAVEYDFLTAGADDRTDPSLG
jgi:hypothetical protein